jgi:hypothetical protein
MQLTAAADALEAVRAERGDRPDPRVEMAALRAKFVAESPPMNPTPQAARARSRRPPLMDAARVRRSMSSRIVTPAGRELSNVAEVAAEFLDRQKDLVAMRGSGRFRVASVRAEFPDDRRLGEDPDANAALIAAVTSLDAITASDDGYRILPGSHPQAVRPIYLRIRRHTVVSRAVHNAHHDGILAVQDAVAARSSGIRRAVASVAERWP